MKLSMYGLMRITLGGKFQLLITFSLTLSIFAIIWIATDLFTTDLQQLIKKNAMDAAIHLSGRIKVELKYIASRAAILGEISLEEFKYSEDRVRLMSKHLGNHSKILGIALFHQSPNQSGFSLDWRLMSSYAKEKLNLTESDFLTLDSQNPLRTYTSSNPDMELKLVKFQNDQFALRIQLPFILAQDKTVHDSLVLEVMPDTMTSLFEETTEFQGLLLDSDGLILASSHAEIFPIGKDFSFLSSLRSLAAQDRNQTISTQSEYLDQQGNRQIAAIHPVGFGHLAVVTQTPYLRSQIAGKELFLRSFFLGSAILLMTLLFTLKISKAVTHSLKLLTQAAQQIGGGDLTARVSLAGQSNVVRADEIGVTARSFNLMADKIKDLLTQTEQKIRMEKELETAQALQKNFFPQSPLQTKSIQVAGGYLPASECAGDWWNYTSIGHHLMVGIGDVTGHGAAAALITAVVHGVYTETVRQEWEKNGSPPDLNEVLKVLNHVVLKTTNGETLMTCLVACIDLHTGVLTLANAAHPSPFLFRKQGPSGYAPQPIPLLGGKGPLLGLGPWIGVTLEKIQLHPGDLLFSFTDGLFEQRISDDSRMRKLLLFAKIKRWLEDPKMTGQDIFNQLFENVLEFYGGPKKLNPDDITMTLTRVCDLGF